MAIGLQGEGRSGYSWENSHVGDVKSEVDWVAVSSPFGVVLPFETT